MTTSNTTPSGVLANNTADAQLDLFKDVGDDGAAAFLGRWKSEDQPAVSENQEVEQKEPEEPTEEPQEGEESTTDDNESAEDPEEEEAAEESDDEAEEGEEEPAKEPKTLDDEAVVEIKVDDENLKVSVKDLKRLYGQEAALTKKSQQVAAKRKEVEQEGLKLSATLDKLYQKAAEKWKPYSEIDMLVAAKTLDADEFTALRQAANAAHEEFRFISEEVNTFLQDVQAKQQQQLKEKAVEAVKVLKEAIPTWNDELYGKIRTYAIGAGMEADLVNNLVDPVAIQILHKARLYDEGKKIATKKVVKAPKRVMTPNSNDNKPSAGMEAAEAMNKLRSTGSTDDAMDAFLSRWSK
jgi:hypothetical protein